MEGSSLEGPPFLIPIDVWEDQMKKSKTSALVALLIMLASSSAVLERDGGSGLVVLKCS